MIQIQALSAYHEGLLALLQDAVETGASIGFLLPFDHDLAKAYWANVFASVQRGERTLWAAFLGEKLVASVQLERCQKQNGLHRAEVQKLLVHSAFRRQGLGRELMHILESHAQEEQLSLLILDTRLGDPAEALYTQLGYQDGGIIPNYVRNSAGFFEATHFFYKQLDRSSIDSLPAAH